MELSGRRRYDARARAEKIDGVPQPGPWWHAVGAPLERLVRPHCAFTARHAFAALLARRLDFPLRAADGGVAGFQAAVPQQLQKTRMLAPAPNELADHHSCLRSAVLQFCHVAPSNCLRAL